MPIDPNNQDPRTTGGGNYTGVYGAGFGGTGAGAQKAQADARGDDNIEQDLENMSASGQGNQGASQNAEPPLNTDDGQAGRLDEME